MTETMHEETKVEAPSFTNGEEVLVRWSVTDDWTPGKFIGMNDDLFVVKTGTGISSYSIIGKKEDTKKSKVFEKRLGISLSFHEHTKHFFVNFSDERGIITSSLLKEPVAVSLSNLLGIAIGQ